MATRTDVSTAAWEAAVEARETCRAAHGDGEGECCTAAAEAAAAEVHADELYEATRGLANITHDLYYDEPATAAGRRAVGPRLRSAAARLRAAAERAGGTGREEALALADEADADADAADARHQAREEAQRAHDELHQVSRPLTDPMLARHQAARGQAVEDRDREIYAAVAAARTAATAVREAALSDADLECHDLADGLEQQAESVRESLDAEEALDDC